MLSANVKKNSLYNNKVYFFSILKKFFITSINNFYFISHLREISQTKFLTLFANKVNFSYFSDCKNVFKNFYRQHFYIYNKYKDVKFAQLDGKFETVKLFTRTKALSFKNEFLLETDSFFKQNVSLNLFLNRCSNFLRKTEFFTFGRIKILKLLFFPLLSKGVCNIRFYNELLKFKQKISFPQSKLYFCFKRIRYFIFLLNHLFNFNNNTVVPPVSGKNIFWFNLLVFFKVLFNYRGHNKTLLYKYNFNLFKKKVFTNRFLIRKTFFNKSIKKAFAFLCSYDRFHKLSSLGFVNRLIDRHDRFHYSLLTKPKNRFLNETTKKANVKKNKRIKLTLLRFSFTRYVRLRQYLLNYQKFGFYFSKFFF